MRFFIPFGMGLYVGLSLAGSADISVMLSACLLMGFMIGATTEEQHWRRQISIHLQGQCQAIEMANTKNSDEVPADTVPEVACFPSDDNAHAVTDEIGK